MASRIFLARSSRNGALSLNRLFSSRNEPSQCGSKLSTMALNRTAPWFPTVSSSPIKVPGNQLSTFSTLLNGTFHRLGFSTKASSQSNPPKAEEATDSDKKVELSREELITLLVEKDELLEIKQKEFKTMKDEVLRSYAELESRMKRTEREAENFKEFAIQVSTLLNGTFQKLGFSSKTWSQSDPPEENGNGKKLSDENRNKKQLSKDQKICVLLFACLVGLFLVFLDLYPLLAAFQCFFVFLFLLSM